MAAFGNKTYQHSFLIAKKEIEDGRSERINFDNNIYRYDDYFVQNDLKVQGREAQGGITCGAIDEPKKSSKAIDKPVIIDFRDKNVVIARFRDKNGGFLFYR